MSTIENLSVLENLSNDLGDFEPLSTRQLHFESKFLIRKIFNL